MFTLCVPNYNRCEMVLESIDIALDNDMISEIVINDDFSNPDIFQKLENKIKLLNNPKVKLYRNNTNLKAFKNKIETVKKSNNDWIILLDSDNRLTHNYLLSIPKILDSNTFYLPSHAICSNKALDYRKFPYKLIDNDLYQILRKTHDEITLCLLNIGNYLVNRNTYLKAVDDIDIEESYAVDVFYTIYLCFKNIEGFKLSIVENMEYYHRLHSESPIKECDSYYVTYSQLSSAFLNKLRNK